MSVSYTHLDVYKRQHYTYGEIKVMVSDDEHMGVFLELKGAGSRNMEYEMCIRDSYTISHAREVSLYEEK